MTFRLHASTLKLDRQVLVETPDGSQLPFRVASIDPLGRSSASVS